MRQATLHRGQSTDEGTFGKLTTADGNLVLRSLELPWRDLNGDGLGDPRKSCVTPGTYECIWHQSPRFGWCYLLQNVKGRSHILIHPANFAGDVDKGWRSELLGCIALGLSVGTLAYKGKKQAALLSSRQAVKTFNDWGGRHVVTLTIK